MTVHATPPHGATTTPCCDTYPGELPEGDRMTLDGAAVSCGQPTSLVMEGWADLDEFLGMPDG